MPFFCGEALKRTFRERDRLKDKGEWWLTIRCVSELLGVCNTTIYRWAPYGCPFLLRFRCLRIRTLDRGNGREATYFSERDVLAIIKKRDKIDEWPFLPEYPGLIEAGIAASELNVSRGSLRRIVREMGLCFERKRVFLSNGRSFPSPYLPRWAFEKIEEYRDLKLRAGRITVDEAVKVRPELTRDIINSHIESGRLKAEMVPLETVLSNGRRAFKKTRLLDREEVLNLVWPPPPLAQDKANWKTAREIAKNPESVGLTKQQVAGSIDKRGCVVGWLSDRLADAKKSEPSLATEDWTTDSLGRPHGAIKYGCLKLKELWSKPRLGNMEGRFLEAIDRLDPDRKGLTFQQLQNGSDLGYLGVRRAFQDLAAKGLVEEVDVERKSGRDWRLKSKYKGVRRVQQLQSPGQVEVNGNGQAAADGARKKPLGDREKYTLLALERLGAFGVNRRATMKRIAKEVEGNPYKASSFAHTLVELRRRGLVDRERGQGGGFWITEAGEKFLESMRKSP